MDHNRGQTAGLPDGPSNGWSGAAARAGQDGEPLARTLGWFSLGLGLLQIVAPRKVAEIVGIDGHDDDFKVLRAVGLREIASGIGILTQARPTPWLWARVGGDAMDLALLGAAMRSPHADRNRVAAATAAVIGVTAADALLSTRLAREPAGTSQGMPMAPPHEVEVKAAITVNAPLDEVYAFWEGFRNLPRFMDALAAVETRGEGRSHWTLSGPAGLTVEFDAEITETRPQELIAWRTVDGSALDASGEVRFRPAPGERGTEVLYEARFRPPGGELGARLAGLFADALGTKAGNDLRRAKQLIEIGEIVHSDDSIVKGPNPAQPRGGNGRA